MNECISQELNDCTQSCSNLYGNYTCACDQMGYSLHRDGVTCQRKCSSTTADNAYAVWVMMNFCRALDDDKI